MKVRHLLVGTSLVVAGSVALSGTPAFAATWSVQPSQAVTTQSGLGSVDLVSATDGWAVGGSFNGGLVERWNGTQWSIVSSVDILDHRNPSNFAGLNGVDAVSASNVYAVGTAASYSFGDGLEHKLAVAERWNGSSWSALTVPNPAVQNEFNAVQAFSSSDVWAVGRSGDTFFGSTLAMHWNGSAWSQVAAPSPGTRDSLLSSLSASSASDVWAVGYYRNLPYGNRARHPLALHWNGQSWSQVPVPEIGSSQTVLQDVVAVSPTDAWAVGYANGTGGITPLVLHWDGQSWTASATPGLATLQTLDSVTALSATNLWVTGFGTDGLPYLANWRGSGWTVTAAPAGGLGFTTFDGLASLAPATVVAAGSTSDSTTGAAQPRVVGTTNG